MNEQFTRYIKLSSADRLPVSSQSNGNFSINIPGNSISLNSVTACKIVSASIPHVFDNINEYNHQFRYSSGGTDYSILFDLGHYDVDVLMSGLCSQLDTQLGGTNTYTQNTLTNLITISLSADITVIDTELSVNVLGFTSSQASVSQTLTASYPLNLSYPDTVFIHSRQISPGTTDYDQSHCIAAVPLEKGYGYINHFYPRDDMSSLFVYSNIRKLNAISLSLRDYKARLLNIKNQQWYIMLKIYYTLQ